MSKPSFTLYSKPLLGVIFIMALVCPPAYGAILPERGGGKFFSLNAARAGKPGGVKIAHAEDNFLPLGSYGGRKIRPSKSLPVVESTTEEHEEANTSKARSPIHSLPVKTSKKQQTEDERREQEALELVGGIEDIEPALVNASALKLLFPDMDEGLAEEVLEEISEGAPFRWPLEESLRQRISSHFGQRADPFTGKPAFHKGIDIAAPIGTKVLACADGVVDTVALHPHLGKYVKIRHEGGDYTVYGHLSATNVKTGGRVKAGDMLGKVGSTGRSTGPHLDFSYRVADKAVDPLPHINVPSYIKTLELSDARE